MLRFSIVDTAEELMEFDMPKKSILVLRINLKSRFIAPAVIQPRLEPWVTKDGKMYASKANIIPKYVFLAPLSTLALSVSVHVPDATEGEILSSMLRFSGFKDCDMKVRVKIVENENHFKEHSVDLSIPKLDNPESQSASEDFLNSITLTKFIASLGGLEIIPAKWLVAELLVAICARGLRFSNTAKYKKILPHLQRTRFFKNTVLLISGSQIIHWVNMNLSISDGLQAAAGNEKDGTILKVWENLLFSLGGKDIESESPPSEGLLSASKSDHKTILNRLGTEPDIWALYILIGLMTVSEQVECIIIQISKPPGKPVKRQQPKNKKVKKVLQEKGTLQR
jgi:hypothetical protein